MPESWASRAQGGPTRALKGPVGTSKGPGLFDLRGFLWSPLLDLLDARSMEASEAWPLRAERSCPEIEVISPNKLADPLGMKILDF